MDPNRSTDFQDIRGQEHVKRILEVATAGGHHLLLTGPPESGKSLLARALPALLPPLPTEAAETVAAIWAEAGLRGPGEPLPERPPVVSARPAGLPTSLFGSQRHPGAVSLAHHGVLLLDDLPVFSATVQQLCLVLDHGQVTLARRGGPLTRPAAFQLIATARPCACGWLGDVDRQCTCTAALVRRHARRIPDALHQRLDLHVQVPPLSYERLTSARLGEPSVAVRARVIAARQIQAARFADSPGITTNAAMGPAELRAHCALDGAGQSLMKAAVRQLALSAGAYHRLLRVARTIADLAGAPQIGAAHIAEGIQYRPPAGA